MTRSTGKIQGIIVAGIVLALLGGGSPAWPAPDRHITVINKAGTAFFHLYAEPAEAQIWENNYLDNVLEAGDSLKVELKQAPKGRWKLMVQDSEGRELVWKDVDLSKHKKVALHEQDGKTWAEVR